MGGGWGGNVRGTWEGEKGGGGEMGSRGRGQVVGRWRRMGGKPGGARGGPRQEGGNDERGTRQVGELSTRGINIEDEHRREQIRIHPNRHGKSTTTQANHAQTKLSITKLNNLVVPLT